MSQKKRFLETLEYLFKANKTKLYIEQRGHADPNGSVNIMTQDWSWFLVYK